MKIQSSPPTSEATLVNPKPINLSFWIAPVVHGLTTRLTYTVPADKKAKLYSAHAGGYVVGAGPTGAFATTVLTLDTAASAEIDILTSQVWTLVANTQDDKIMTGAIDLVEGDILRIKTQNNDAAGIVLHTITALLIESDA